MKNLLILLVASTFATVGLSQNTYLPFIGQNKYWIYGQDNGWDINPRQIEAFIFTIGDDTLINELTYSKLIKHQLPGESPCSGYPCFTPYIPYQINTNHKTAYAYLREDTLSKKVYCLPAFDSYKFCDSTEHVLYDFNQEVGDTLIRCNSLIHSGWPITDHYFVIDSVNTEYMYNKTRKVWYFNGFTYGGLPYIINMRMIEGIGIDRNLGFYTDYTVTFGGYCEGTLEQCNIISQTQDEVKISKPMQVTFIPNPSGDQIELLTDIEMQKCQIFDQNGRIVISTTEKEINVRHLSSGVYFVKCLGTNNTNYFSKFVKM
ncbi:MAG: T9SS type A sorting domain-containing protein [Saprospiraceae bacterium]